MIPPEAIKPIISKSGRDNTELAVGTLIAYRVVPQTQEGIQKAKDTIAANDNWLVPSLLPNYYDGIDSDLMTGKETAGIINISGLLKEFYGLTTKTAEVETAVDTRVKQPPATPTPSATDTRVSQPIAAKEKKKNNLKPKPYAKDNIDRWSRLTGYELDSLSDYTRDQLRALASKYGIKRYSSYKDKNELAEVIRNTVAYQQAAPKTVEKKVEKVNLPKPAEQPSTIKIPQAHYIQGQRGRWEPEFENDIDHAVYYAGKSPIPKGDKQREVLAWLKSLSLTYEQIHDHREKVLAKMRETIAVPGVEEEYPYVYIDAVDQDFVIEDDEEEDESEYDDLYGSSVDDLISSVLVEEEPSADDQEVNAQATVATQVLTEAEDAREQEIDESILDDLPEELRNSLTGFINKRTGKTSPTTEKKSTSSYVSNNKIFKFLTNNIFKIQGQLDSINKSIQNQTELIRANLELTASVHENLNIQNDILARKLDAILEAIDGQKGLANKFADDEENRLAEARLESGMDVAGTETATDTRNGKKSSGNSLLRRLIKFFGRKLASKLWKTLVPKAIRSRLRLARRALGRVKRIPSRLASKLASKIAPKVVQKTAQNVATTVSTRAVAKGFEHIALPGVTKAAQQADAPAAKAITKSGNIFQRAFASPVIQKALVKTLGEEGAKKLTVKLAAKLLPIAGTAYGLGEGLARIAMGDVKGGFLSFGSAIPVGGVAFAAVDILRDINTDAYTRHIESNLPTPSDQNFAAFFADALGVTEDQYETGGETNSSKTVMLHGTELLRTPQSQQAGATQAVDPIGGTIVATTTKFINSMGPAAASVAPMFEQAAAPLAKIYDIPSVLVQTNIGGAFPSMQATLSKVKEKRKMTPEEELSGMEKDLLGTQDPQSFADKLLKMLDPEGKFQQLLQQINNRNNPDAPTVDGDSLYAEGGDAVTSGDIYSAYGMRSGGMHKGIDLSSAKFKQGTPISVIKPGKVVFAGWQDPNNHKAGWGQFVAIKHDDGTVSLYGHLDQINVSSGQRVEPDSSGKYPVIGKLGNTGRSDGPHLHFEVGTGWNGRTLTGHMNPASVVGQYLRGGGNVKKKESTGDAPQVTLPTAQGLGKQGTTGNKDFGATSGVGSKGYMIVPGHAAGGGAPEEKKLVKQLAKNAYTNLKSKFPDANVHYQDTDSMFGDTDEGFKKQLAWFKQKEKEGWEILEVHMDASMESGEGTGRGVIAPTGELNPVEAYFAQNYGAFTRGHRDLGAPKRGVGLIELGNMSPELQQASKQNKVSKQQLDALTAPLETSIQSALNISPPTQRQPAQSKYYLKQGGDKKADTQIVMIPAASSAGKAIEKNGTVEGQRFTYNSNYNAFQTQEIPSATRTLLLRRLGLN